ncbi:putative outer membrane protein [Oceanicola granulosus HTCC2516]|uniref:Putative outer membrane protein n=2 Tax=Oceanicola granulosus TaxID=252302 RepID=Q2CC78_OCEGH|nr:putative outer membrane protein [Oceanicola granulosus HTCC2516]
MAAALCALASPALAVRVSLDAGAASEELDDQLRDASLLITLDDEDTPTAQDFVASARADYRRLLTALYANGYYGGAVSILIDGREAASIAPLGAPASIERIRILVDPGPRFTFGRTAITPLAPGTELPEGFRPGERARSTIVRTAVGAAIEGWRQQGNAKAEVASEDITARHPAQQLDVDVGIAPGPVLTFGNLIVTGNERVRTERIVAIAGLPTGTRYDPDEIETATARLRRTGAFSAVALEEADAIGPGNTLPIEATIVEDEPRRIGFGIEVSSVEGLTLSGFWLHRNLLGGAERFRIEGEINGIATDTEEIDYELDLSFDRPATFGPDTALFANLRLERVQDPEIDLTGAEGDIGLSRIVTEDLTVTGALGFRAAEVRTDLGTNQYLLLTLPVTAELDRRDDPLDAKSGYYIDTELTPFIGLDSAESGARLFADARAYRSFGTDDRFTVAGRLQLGSVVGPEGPDAPADFLFYSGGGGTVRGQPFQSLGVEVGDATIGGTSFLGAQLEGRVRVRDRISAVGFYDYGQVGDDPYPTADDPSHAGAGIGVRYDTGIGPIRLDVATPVSGDDAFEAVQLYIGIGQAF